MHNFIQGSRLTAHQNSTVCEACKHGRELLGTVLIIPLLCEACA